MRGLTTEERFALTRDDGPISEEAFAVLQRRGLMRVSDCEDCGAIACNCDCPRQWLENTAEGELALRLDAAARAMSGVTA